MISNNLEELIKDSEKKIEELEKQNVKSDNENLNEKIDLTYPGMPGWVCPKCGRVYSPCTMMCPYCGPKGGSNTHVTYHGTNCNANQNSIDSYDSRMILS